jgi:hypothetical protein
MYQECAQYDINVIQRYHFLPVIVKKYFNKYSDFLPIRLTERQKCRIVF